MKNNKKLSKYKKSDVLLERKMQKMLAKGLKKGTTEYLLRTTLQYYWDYLNNTSSSSRSTIRNVRLNETDRLMEVNNGAELISFKSKKKAHTDTQEGLTTEEEKELKRKSSETKEWKILLHLWEVARWELKGGSITQKGSIASLENLKTDSGCKTKAATYQHIKRLNMRFKKKNLPIRIKGEDEKYRIFIYR